MHTTLLNSTQTVATLAGTAGTSTFEGPFYQPGNVVFESAVGTERLLYRERQIVHDALHFEAAEVARRLSDGRTRSHVSRWRAHQPACTALMCSQTTSLLQAERPATGTKIASTECGG